MRILTDASSHGAAWERLFFNCYEQAAKRFARAWERGVQLRRERFLIAGAK